MLKLIGNDIYRGEDKIGWLENNHVFDRNAKKLGYFDDAHVYDVDTTKIAYISGDILYDAGGAHKARLEDVLEAIEGILPNIAKCAIYILLGA
jgi:hypothetical protein